MSNSVLRQITPLELQRIRDTVVYDPTVPNGLGWLVKRKGRRGSGIGRTFWIDQLSYQASHIVMILNGKWPSDGDLVVTRIDKKGSWGDVDNLKWSPFAGILTGARDRKRQQYLQDVFGNNIPELGPKLRLATLCKRGHEWNGHPVTLQFKDGDYWRCKACHREAKPLKRDPDAPRLSRKEYRRLYKARQRIALREQGLTSRGVAPVNLQGETAALARAIRTAGRSPSVARLVMDEQLRHWREHPRDRAAHDRQWAQASWWLQYQINPDLRLYHREKSKRRKARNRGQTPIQIPVAALRQRFNQFGNCCAYCGAGGDMEIEHVCAISKGGAHDIGNIVPACSSCNTSKRNHSMEKWYCSQSFFSELRLHRIRRVIRPPEGQQLALALA